MSTKYHPHHRLSESSKCNIINIVKFNAFYIQKNLTDLTYLKNIQISVINSRANYTIISLPNPPNDNTKQLPSKQLSKQTEFSASSLIPLFITGKYNNIPNLVSILWDIYCQLKLLKLSQSKKTPPSLSLPKNYSFEHFLLCSPLGIIIFIYIYFNNNNIT